MKTIVCTLFEGHYHYGVAALVNSLYKQGYRGKVYAGYRGELPPWIKSLERIKSSDRGTEHAFIVADGLVLIFVALETDYHLTNYKPDFLLWLSESVDKTADAYFYFDPDIVIAAPWIFFEDWVKCGLALCEDVNSPLARHHPRRSAWRVYFGERGLLLKHKDTVYANGGFIGLTKENISFLQTWKTVQELMAPTIGGLNRSSLEGTPLLEKDMGPFTPFGKTDQDALNAAIEAWDGRVSFVGKEGMGFIPGAALLPHALGLPKPWKRRFYKSALAGYPPRRVDKEYWKYANDPILSHLNNLVFRRQVAIKLAALIGRFYKRGSN